MRLLINQIIKTMKKIVLAILALAVVGLYSCKKENVDEGNNTTTTTPGGNQGGGNQPGGGGGQQPGDDPTPQRTSDEFVGQWNMELYGNSNAHVVVTVNPLLSTGLAMIGQELAFGDMDEIVSFAGTPMTLSIAQGSGSQMTVSGTITLDLNASMGIEVDPIDVSFNTSAVFTENGLMIQAATISESVPFMTIGTMALDGQITFDQQTGFPTDGVLDVTIATLHIDGVGTVTIPLIGQEIPNAATVTVDGEQLKAHGTK